MERNAFIPDIDTLRQTVRISASMPYESVLPFINDAVLTYLNKHIGTKMVRRAESDADTDGQLVHMVRCAIGPLAMFLATDELGVFYGDSGLTVDNVQGKRSPANEAKIAASKNSMKVRGLLALDRLLAWLDDNTERYPEYAEHIRTSFAGACFITTAQQFQAIGQIDIDHSVLFIRRYWNYMLAQQERHVRPVLGDELYLRMLGAGHTDSAAEARLREVVVRFMANKAAELYVAQMAAPDSKQFYDVRVVDMACLNSSEFYANEAAFHAERMAWMVERFAAELGIEDAPPASANVNSKRFKLFTSIS